MLGDLTLAFSVFVETARARRRRGPLRPSWSFFFEVAVALLRRQNERVRSLSPEGKRAAWARLSLPDPALLGMRRHVIEADGVPGEWFEPRRGVGAPVLLYLHGGSYIFGSTRTHASLIARLTRVHGGRTLGLNYRLAPEHPFPSAIEDVLRAYRWLLSQGVPAHRIVVAGDSAGGGLTLAMLAALRDAGDVLPAGAALLCPWVDLTARGGSLVACMPYDWGREEDILAWAETYLAGADPRDPRASPLFADLRGLPPLLIQVGEAEMLLDQVRDLVGRATAQGASAELQTYPDMVHNWHLLSPLFPRCRAAIESAGRFILTRATLSTLSHA